MEADRNTDRLEDSALNLERRKIKREEGAKAAKALESLDVKPAEEVKGADVDLIVSVQTGFCRHRLLPVCPLRMDRAVKRSEELCIWDNVADKQVKELGVSKEEAQAALRAEKGDVVKALVQLTAPGRR